MPRRKIQMGLIGKAGSLTRTFNGRKEGLKKKARELAILCDVDVALVCAGPRGGAPADVWEFGAGVIDRYRRLPADKRAKHTHLGYLNIELGKEKARLAKERQEGPKELASPSAAVLKGVNLEELLGSIDAALLATAKRRKALGMPDDGIAGGGQLRQAAVVPLEQGVRLAGDADLDDMEAWVDELTWHGVEPHPLNASMTMQPASGGVQYINGVEPRPLNASMAQPASGAQYINSGSMCMAGNQYLQQVGGNGENAHGQLLPWDAYQLHNTASCPDHGFFQYTGSNCSYSDMSGCPQMPVPSNANAYNGWFDQAMWGADESSCDAAVPVEYHHQPSLHITGNPAYMPPEHSSMGTGGGDCFTGVSPIGLDGSFMDASGHGYGTQCLADNFQCPDATQQFGVEPLHYLSDVAEGISYYDDLGLFDHSSSGTVQFGSELSQSGVLDQDSGVQKFWLMKEAAGFY
ncbi:hypothetical protein SEVIR_5G430700v4 [Setaria viridis]|uniref:uncharacterized protein n=1 Tax=Setaria viridis TaxID=4556 RepID=UPI003B3BAC2A